MTQRVRFCGVDLGSRTLHLACLTDPAPGEPGLLTASGPAPGPWADRCPEAAALGGALVAASEGLGVRLRRVHTAVSLPSGAMVVKAVNLPALRPAERRAALYLEIDRLTSVEAAETVGDWLPLAVPGGGQPGPDGQGHLLLTARQQTVDAIGCALRVAAMRPAAVEPEPATLLGLAQLLARPDGEAAEVLVDLGASATRLVVVRRGELLLFRELPVGGSDLTAALAEHLGVDPADAEELKCTEYQEGEDLGEFGAAGERLVREVERSLRYVEQGYRLEGYGALHLVGGGARWPLLRRQVEAAVGIRARESIELPVGPVDPAMAEAAALALWRNGRRPPAAAKGGARR